jgi:hypothetical protein
MAFVIREKDNFIKQIKGPLLMLNLYLKNDKLLQEISKKYSLEISTYNDITSHIFNLLYSPNKPYIDINKELISHFEHNGSSDLDIIKEGLPVCKSLDTTEKMISIKYLNGFLSGDYSYFNAIEQELLKLPDAEKQRIEDLYENKLYPGGFHEVIMSNIIGKVNFVQGPKFVKLQDGTYIGTYLGQQYYGGDYQCYEDPNYPAYYGSDYQYSADPNYSAYHGSNYSCYGNGRYSVYYNYNYEENEVIALTEYIRYRLANGGIKGGSILLKNDDAMLPESDPKNYCRDLARKIMSRNKLSSDFTEKQILFRFSADKAQNYGKSIESIVFTRLNDMIKSTPFSDRKKVKSFFIRY